MAGGDCIFCRIASGEVPSRKVLDRGECLAFLDVAPLAPGHALLIPKNHYPTLDSMPAETAGALLRHLPDLTRAILAATGAEGVNVLLNNGPAAGQVVMHAHCHIIPRRSGDELGYRWPAGRLNESEADALRGRIIAALSG